MNLKKSLSAFAYSQMAASWVPSFTANCLDDVKALVSKLIGRVYCGDHLWKSNQDVDRATPHVV